MTEFFQNLGMNYEWAWFVATIAGILLIALPLMLAVAYVILIDRKVWAAINLRKGPNVVGPFGLLQSFADGLKVFLQETIIPSAANKGIFIIAPIITFTVALAAWVFGEFMQRTVPKSSKPLLVCGLILAAGYALALEWGLDWRHPENRKIVGGGIEVKVDGVQWKKWSPEAVAEARTAGHPVLIDFTAKWCVS